MDITTKNYGNIFISPDLGFDLKYLAKEYIKNNVMCFLHHYFSKMDQESSSIVPVL